ncbi:hypothetical protein WDU94_010122 [Cyamophila willieti]
MVLVFSVIVLMASGLQVSEASDISRLICCRNRGCRNNANRGPSYRAQGTPTIPTYSVNQVNANNEKDKALSTVPKDQAPTKPVPVRLDRINCYYENVVHDEVTCLDTGCLWDPLPSIPNSGPPCFYPKDFVKVDCFSSGGDMKESCLAKGCHWNLFKGEQSCFYPPNYKTLRTDLPQCTSDTFTATNRKPCILGGAIDTMSKSGCISAGCCWSPLKNGSAEPWCYFPWNVRDDSKIQQPVQEQCPAAPNDRFNCFPRGVENQRGCNARGCCWTMPDQGGQQPPCYYPYNYKSYALETLSPKTDNTGPRLTYRKQIDSPYPDDFELVQMDIEYETDTRVRVKISNPNVNRYESIYPRISKSDISTTSESTRKYKVTCTEIMGSSFGFAIERKASNQILFDTRNVGGFTMSDQFLQVSAKLGSRFVYGLGEVSKSFLTDFNWKTFGLFAKHLSTKESFNGNSGSHPFYLAMEADADGRNSSTGRAHGVLLLNSNALEVELQPKASITYRATGGILDFYFFLGETPSEVIQQYLELIGKPNLPPYWSLGFQVSKTEWNDLEEMKTVVSRTIKNKIPLDAVYGGVEYRPQYRDSLQNLPEYVAQLHSLGIKFVSLFDPTIESNDNYTMFIKGKELDVFVKQRQKVRT